MLVAMALMSVTCWTLNFYLLLTFLLLWQGIAKNSSEKTYYSKVILPSLNYLGIMLNQKQIRERLDSFVYAHHTTGYN